MEMNGRREKELVWICNLILFVTHKRVDMICESADLNRKEFLVIICK